MTTSTHTSLTAIDRQLQAGHLPVALTINRASIGIANGDGKIIKSHARTSISPSSRLTDYIVFSALCLIAMVEIWRGLRDWIFSSYRPELHYMRGPGPKSREQYAQGR
jgi:hypothetical protein